jgi:hypothetical protein
MRRLAVFRGSIPFTRSNPAPGLCISPRFPCCEFLTVSLAKCLVYRAAM